MAMATEVRQWRHWWELRAYLHGIVAVYKNTIYYQSNTFPNKMHIFAICDVAEPFNISFYGADNCAQTLKPSDSKQWDNHCLNGPPYLSGAQAAGRVPQLCDNGWTDFQLWKHHFILIQCWVGGINHGIASSLVSWSSCVSREEKRFNCLRPCLEPWKDETPVGKTSWCFCQILFVTKSNSIKLQNLPVL